MSIRDLLTDLDRLFFPPVPEAPQQTEEEEIKGKEEETATATDAKREEELEAEAQAVASVLPDPPTSDPADADEAHVEKKQKRDGE